MTGSNRIPSLSSPQPSRRTAPVTREQRPLSPAPLSPGPAVVGTKRPPAVAFGADNSPNKLPRVASPTSRWACEVPTTHAASHEIDAAAIDEAPTWDISMLDDLLDDALPQNNMLDWSIAHLDDTASGGDPDPLSNAHGAANTPQAHEPAAAVQLLPTRIQKPTNLAAVNLTSAHQVVMMQLSSKTQKSADIVFVLRFLHHLESLGLDWDSLRGDTKVARPLELEAQVNAAINGNKVSSRLRSTLNRIYELRLQGNKGIRPIWKPTSPAHLKFIAEKIPPSASQKEIGHIRSVLGCLEADNIEWDAISQPLINNHLKRPLALEVWMNTAIAEGRIIDGTRNTFNKLFGLLIKPPVAEKYKLPEHTELIATWSHKMVGRQKAQVVNFLVYLESIDSCWSHEIELPEGSTDSKRPMRLEKTVNFATSRARKPRLHCETRAVLNSVFGYELRSSITPKPKKLEHLSFLDSLRTTLPNNKPNRRKVFISQFFYYLESENKLFSDVKRLIPGDQPRRPSELEKIVNELIANNKISGSLRSALNRAFNLDLKGPSGRCFSAQPQSLGE
jgi:hypothetical protein